MKEARKKHAVRRHHNRRIPLPSVTRKLGLLLVGGVVAFLMLEVALRYGGYIFLARQEFTNRRQLLQNKSQLRILCLGESTTAVGGDMAYPAQLEEMLVRVFPGSHRVAVINKGIPGANSERLVAAAPAWIQKYQPDLVVAMMGINDYGVYANIDRQTSVWSRLSRLSRVVEFVYRGAVLGRMKYSTPLPSDSFFRVNAAQQTARRWAAVRPLPADAEDPQVQQGWAYLERGDEQSARDCFAAVRQRLPRQVGAVWATAVLQFDSSDYTGALETLLPMLSPAEKDHEMLYLIAGLCYRETGDVYRARQSFLQVLTFNPENVVGYQSLIDCYLRGMTIPVGAEFFDKMIANNPACDWGYTGQGWDLVCVKRYDEALVCFYEALVRDARSSFALEGVAHCLVDAVARKTIAGGEAVTMLEDFVQQGAWDPLLLHKLAGFYLRCGQVESAARIYSQITESNANDMQAWAGLSYCEETRSQSGQRRYYKVKQQNVMHRLLPRMTQLSYQLLADVTRRYQIRLMCISYPRRSVEPVRNVLADFPDVLYVDNQQTFENALRQSCYEDLFIDNFAGDFGHCTAKGNRLLAENVARAIEREFRGKLF